MEMENNKKGIPVVFGTDQKYVLQVFVVIRSILMHSSEYFHFFVLTFDNIEDEVKKYTNILNGEYNNFIVSVRMVDKRLLEKAKICNQHLSIATYFRLLIPELIPEFEKCIYLDCDLIVYGDLKELYDIELENNYLAGARDCHIIQDSLWEKEHQLVLGIPSRERYVNAGVLVMNLKKIREDKLVACFLEQMKKDNWYEDQDVLNYCCYPYIKVISLKYNLFHFYLGKNMVFLQDCPYKKEEIDFDYEKPFIVHMGGRNKPWNSFAVKKSKEWWENAEIFKESYEYVTYWQRCCDEKKVDQTSNMIDRAKHSNYIVVWGYTSNGKRLCDILLEYNLSKQITIVDNNSSVWGEEYKGINVKSFDDVLKESRNVLWLISCQVSYKEVERQLIDNGISESNIIRYVNYYDDILHLLSIDKHYYINEIDKIANMEYVKMIPDRNERVEYIKNIITKPTMKRKDYKYLSEKYNLKYWLETLNY